MSKDGACNNIRYLNATFRFRITMINLNCQILVSIEPVKISVQKSLVKFMLSNSIERFVDYNIDVCFKSIIDYDLLDKFCGKPTVKTCCIS